MYCLISQRGHRLSVLVVRDSGTHGQRPLTTTATTTTTKPNTKDTKSSRQSQSEKETHITIMDCAVYSMISQRGHRLRDIVVRDSGTHGQRPPQPLTIPPTPPPPPHLLSDTCRNMYCSISHRGHGLCGQVVRDSWTHGDRSPLVAAGSNRSLSHLVATPPNVWRDR